MVGLAGRSIAVAAALTLVAAGAAQAQAPPPGKKLSPDQAKALESGFGGKGAGTYYDQKSGNMVVAVSDEVEAKKVRAFGGIAKLVKNSGGKLDAIQAALKDRVKIPGTSFGIDPTENKVVLSVDDTVDAKELAKIKATIKDAPEAVRLEKLKGQFKLLIAGGDSIVNSSSRCSLGFNVMRGTVPHYLTAGHCGNLGGTWLPVSSTVVASSFPGDDFALMRYTSPTPLQAGAVTLWGAGEQDITAVGNPVVGQAVKRSGSTTGLRSGTIQALNQTVNYGGGRIVSGLIRTNVCAEPGDSGGALFSGTFALGLTSGGSGNCSVGGTTFYQPVNEAMSRWGLTIY